MNDNSTHEGSDIPNSHTERKPDNLRRDLQHLMQVLIARNYNNIGKWHNEVQQYNYELIQEVEKILIDNQPTRAPQPETELQTYVKGRIAEAFKCLETGMWEHWPFDDCTREQIEGMKRAYGDILIKIQNPS